MNPAAPRGTSLCSRQRGSQRGIDLGPQRRQRLAWQLVVLYVRVVHLAQQALEVPHVLGAQQCEHAPCAAAGSLSGAHACSTSSVNVCAVNSPQQATETLRPLMCSSLKTRPACALLGCEVLHTLTSLPCLNVPQALQRLYHCYRAHHIEVD